MLPRWLLFCCFFCEIVSQRETITFDFAWKFHRGDPPGQTVQCGFSKNTSGTFCDNLHWTPVGRKNPVDCERNCCIEPTCTHWQWSSGYGHGHGCYQGFKGDSIKCTQQKGYVGGQRDTMPPLPNWKYHDRSFDDSKWEAVDVPHDFIIYGKFGSQYDEWHGYLPREQPGWYRKHFRIPPSWETEGEDGKAFWLQFDGVFQLTEVWVNGYKVATHEEGYLPFLIQLNPSMLTSENVLAVRVDASWGSGHWYEGGGIFRHVWISKTEQVHLEFNGGVFSRANKTHMFPEVTVINEDPGDTAQCYAALTLYDNSGNKVSSAKTSTLMVDPKKPKTLTVQENMVPQGAISWSVTTPYLYSLSTVVMCKPGGSTEFFEVDSANTSVGFRDIKWTAPAFYLNNDEVKLRGFSHHNDFAGTGVEVRPRIDLYQAQAARWSGSNAWRMSHNPYHTALYDILDGLGVLVWDENRDYLPSHYVDMGTLVKRDRNHPSVVIWSLCNEIECHQDPGDNTTQEKFANQIRTYDPNDRPISANENEASTPIIASVLQVQGYSHRNNQSYEQFHKEHPNEPIVASECCSCQSQRQENNKNDNGAYYPVWNGDCIQKDVAMAYSKERPWISGSLGVWTLFDYIGEPRPGWPLVSCSYGQFDLAGFSKSAAFWYHSWWLCNIESKAGRPPIPQCQGSNVRIVESWDSTNPPPGNTIHVFSDAPKVQLQYDSEVIGETMVDYFSYATFTLKPHQVPTHGTTLTATALSSTGSTLAQTTITAAGGPAKLKLVLDAPSITTGTGTKVVLDGEDIALIRVRVEDNDGNLVEYATNMIQFKITSGPGRIVGVGNGDPASHEPNKASQRTVYHGLARVIVQSNLMSIQSDKYRKLLADIDVDSGSITRIAPTVVEPVPIVVTATSPGLQADSITIETSVDTSDLPTNVVKQGYPKIQQQQLQF